MGVLSAYNFATHLAAYHCAEPSPIIWAATFIPAVAPALIEFVGFGCRDILKFRLGRSAPCGRMLKAQVNKAIPPSWMSTTQKLMKFEEGVSKAGFWFMIVDLASDTTIRWSTLAFRFSDCAPTNAYASWQYEPFFEDVLFPGVPKPVVGQVTNYVGEFGHATINGAVCPEDWYFQGSFHCDWRPFPGFDPGSVTLWIQESGATAYDFPGTNFGKSGYPWQRTGGGYSLKTQNHQPGARSFTMWAMADERTIISGATGNMTVSQLEPMELSVKGLNCWTDPFKSDVEDPAGRNKKNKPANILAPVFNPVTPKPVRGRPGGLPRSKK